MLHSENFYPHVLMYPINKMALILELMLLVEIITERLSSMMNLRITAKRAGRESKSSSSRPFCLTAEVARPFPHMADVIKATLRW